MELELRAIRGEDAPTVLACWNQSAPRDPLTTALLDEKIWQDPGFDPERAVVALRGGAAAGFAMAVRRGDRGVIKLLAVHPRHRRQGVGSALVDRVARGWSGEIRVGESPPNYLVPGVDEADGALRAFFGALGFEWFETTHNLRVDLRELPADTSPGPAGYRIARALPRDADAVARLLDRNWRAWQGEVDTALARGRLFLAWKDGEVAGFSAHDANNFGTGWFGPMGTDPAHRGQGLGRLLLIRSLEDLRAMGMPEAVIPWVGPIGFYRKAVGARLDRTFLRYRRVRE